MFIPVTHHLSLTRIRRERILPQPGTVFVTQGQKVRAADLIAETRLESRHLLLDVSRMLGIPPKQTHKVIKVSLNQVVAKDDILAGPVGVLGRSVHSPCNAKVVYLQDGQIMLEYEARLMPLYAGMEGVVQKVIPGRGAILETTGALIQGMWGNGQIGQGRLQECDGQRNTALCRDGLAGDLEGVVLLAGYLNQVPVLSHLSTTRVSGLILGGMSANLLPLAAQCRFPVIVLEGFGSIPVNGAAYRILSSHDGREVMVNANGWQRYSDSRPEVMIHLPGSEAVSYPAAPGGLAVGSRVLIKSGSMNGITGKIIALNLEQPATRVPCVTVDLDDGTRSSLPPENLELLVQDE